MRHTHRPRGFSPACGHVSAISVAHLVAASQRALARLKEPPQMNRTSVLPDPLRGIALSLGATVLFATSDTIAKFLTAHLPVIEIAWIRYVVFVAIAGWLATRAAPHRRVAAQPAIAGCAGDLPGGIGCAVRVRPALAQDSRGNDDQLHFPPADHRAVHPAAGGAGGHPPLGRGDRRHDRRRDRNAPGAGRVPSGGAVRAGIRRLLGHGADHHPPHGGHRAAGHHAAVVRRAPACWC